MIKIGTISLNDTPRTALAISDEEDNKTLMSLPVDVLEVRVDQFKNLDIEHIKKNIRARKKIKIPF